MEVPPSQPSTRCWSDIVQNQAPSKPQEVIARHVFSSCTSSKGIAVAIVDANAIIQGGEKLISLADKLVSVREVLEEVRDPVSRHRLAVMPFNVEIMDPSPDALKKVINFARSTGDLQTLSDVDLKLIALAYTLEAQIHGTNHLRDIPPPLRVVNVKRLSEKELPGWGNNVPNVAEWDALENASDSGLDLDSRILQLKDLNMNVIPVDDHRSDNNSADGGADAEAANQEDGDHCFSKGKRFRHPKKEINIEGKKMVADGIDASKGEVADDANNWQPAVSRSTHRRYLRRQARRALSGASEKLDHTVEDADMNTQTIGDGADIASEVSGSACTEAPLHRSSGRTQVEDEEEIFKGGSIGNGDLNSSKFLQEDKEADMSSAAGESHDHVGNESIAFEEVVELSTELDQLEISSQMDESVGTSLVDDGSSEQSWMLRSLSNSSVACVTSDFAMQNVILQIGLWLLAPGGIQIRQLHRWILKCHACNRVTAEIGRIFCPKCGNGGTLRKVSATVGENGIILAARRPRITLRGTKFSLPLPQGGRDAITKNLILREDQLPHKVLYPRVKKKPGNQDLDFLSSDDIFSHTADKRAPLKPPVRKALAVFSGKRNPNDNHFSRGKH